MGVCITEWPFVMSLIPQRQQRGPVLFCFFSKCAITLFDSPQKKTQTASPTCFSPFFAPCDALLKPTAVDFITSLSLLFKICIPPHKSAWQSYSCASSTSRVTHTRLCMIPGSVTAAARQSFCRALGLLATTHLQRVHVWRPPRTQPSADINNGAELEPCTMQLSVC